MGNTLLSKLEDYPIPYKEFSFLWCSEADKRNLYELFLEIIEEGKSYPQQLPYPFEDFINYFFPQGSRALICKKDNEVVGGFYIKPNFPGKSAHIANCGYIVKKKYRGQEIGFHLGKYSIDLAKEMGYRSIIFNLVFSSNIGAVNLWEKLGFQILGTIPGAVRVDQNNFQDGFIMFLDLKKSPRTYVPSHS